MSQLQVTGEAKIRDIQGPVVANSGVITALDGAASQYVRGDGTLADFPTSTGGGSSVSYYLNSSVSQGTIGGVAYRELSKEPIIGAGTDITISANGYVASYITDANDPDVLSVPGGNFNCEFYFSVNNNTGNPTTYAELYKYDGTTFTLLGSSQAVPESLNQGTTIAPYYFAIPVATAALALTDRLAIRIYVNVDGRTVTLHTENSHLCQVVTTFSKGMVSLNNLTDQSQFITTGTSGTDFNIVSSGDTHTFNIPSASNNNRGLITNLAQTIGGIKTFSSNINADSGIRLKNGVAPSANGYVGIGSNTQGLTLGVYDSGSSYYHELYFPYTNGYEYTFPSTSGTLALTSNLSAYVPYTGATGNVDLGLFGLTSNAVKAIGDNSTYGGVISIKQNNVIGGLIGTGYTELFGKTNRLGISFGAGSIAYLSNSVLTAERTYTLPDATGTIALTSNLSSYVPYTGATANVDLGTRTLNASGISSTGQIAANGFLGALGGLVFAKGNTPASFTLGDVILYSESSSNNIVFRDNTSKAKLDFNNSTQTYTFPAATGTIALTSNLSAYLPLTGGTLTGGLSGTTATFSGLGTFYQLTMTGATAGRIFYAQTGGVISQSGNLNWNETNGMLGVGTPNPTAVITAFSTNAATQFKAAGTAPAFTFSESLTTSTYACVFGLATSANHFITGTAAGDMAIANQSATAGAIVFGTGTAEKMRMSPSGNFGLGTSNPSSYTNLNTITINGTSGSVIDFKTGEVLYGELYSLANEMRVDAVGASGVLKLLTNSVPRLTIASTGAATFSSSVTATQINASANFYASSTAPTLVLTNAAQSTTFGYLQHNGTDLTLNNSVSGGKILLSGGNVGIGTSSPSEKLDVIGGAVAAGNGTIRTGITYSSLGLIGTFTNHDLGIITNGTERMRITSGGNVGIGMSPSSNTLAVKGSTDGIIFAVGASNAYKAEMQVEGAGQFTGSFVAIPSSASAYGGIPTSTIGITTSSTALVFATSNAERMRITSGGKLLVGTSTAGYGLYTEQRMTLSPTNDGITVAPLSQNFSAYTVQANNDTGTRYALNIANSSSSSVGNISFTSSSTSYNTSSDYRLKQDLKDFNGLSLVSAIKTYDYEWKTDNTRAFGVLAHELAEVLPQAVTGEKDGEQMQGVDYSKIVPILVKAIQEEDAKVNAQELRIQQLESQIEELKALINK